MQDLTQGSPVKLMLSFTFPMLLGNIFQQCYNISDSVIVGNFVGVSALAAVGAAYPVMFTLLAFCTGLTVGSSTVISQLYGAGKQRETRRAVSTMLLSMMLLGLAFAVVGILLTRPLLMLIQTPADVFEDTVVYVRFVFGGAVFMYLYNALAAVFRALGDSRTPLVVLIFSSVLNILLDLALVLLFHWNVAGVAFATLLAQGISSALCFVHIYRRVPELAFRREEWVIDKELLSAMVRYAIPSMIQQSVVSLSMMSVQGLVNSYGSNTSAAYGAACKIDSIASMPMQSFSLSMSTFAAQNIGAGQLGRVRKCYRSCLMVMLTVSLIITVGVYFGGDLLMGCFLGANRSEEVIAIGHEYLKIVSLFYFVLSISNISSGVLKGSGDLAYFTVCSMVNFVSRLVMAYVLSATALGRSGIWWSVPIGWSICGAMLVQRYLSGKWTDKKLAILKEKSPVPPKTA